MAVVTSSDPGRVDRDIVHRWLSELSYWAPGISRERFDASLDGSLVFGAYDSVDGRQLGFARVITDGATFAWLADVFVDPESRGDGIGKVLMDAVMAELQPLGLRRIMLVTADAHSLYERYGFAVPTQPERLMARMAPA